jgi:tetratricopeptide (TPR) repeat protein
MRVTAPVSLLLSGLLLYGLLIGPFTAYMRNKPIEEKLGYVPSIKLLKPLSADQKELAGAALVMKVLMYFGGVAGKAQEGRVISESPDLQGMSRLLHGAVQLDPYNMDAYYFAQGFLTWDARQFKVANDLLDYGMKYRTWDWQLPFFAGFNNAFFLKEYLKAAEYYQRAGELSGQPLYKSLAGRYLQESGQTGLAIVYLTAMEKGERNPAMKKGYQLRLQSFQEVLRIEQARDRFREKQGVLPDSVEQLLQQGYLNPAPVDPYGGRFYLESSGKVATTSKFAFATKNK